jgi:formylglycine-generating enzyme
MKYLVKILVFLLSLQVLTGQSLSVFDVDASNFPTIKAKFFAFAQDGKQITNLNPSDFEIREDGQSRTISNVSCPAPKPLQAISSVLVFDVSSSMTGAPLDLEKGVANSWINMLSLGNSDCAITSFSDDNYINQDFTTNKNKLINGINSLGIIRGTDYNAALIDPAAGGILMAKTGKHKRIIIFLTDGQPNFEPRTQEIIDEANMNDITIYCLALYMPAHHTMKKFANQTGGLYFENIRSKKEADEALRKILILAQNTEFCEIEWLSGISCQTGLINAELKYKPLNLITHSIYNGINNPVAKLEFDPKSVKFLNAIHDTCITVTVTAKNSTFNISNITTSYPLYRINPPTNFILNAGESRKFTICYSPTPGDSGYTFCKITFENDLCIKNYFASGGFSGKNISVQTLKLIQPNGNEVFVAGTDTVITWDGVSPDVPVTIMYRTDDLSPWKLLTDTAKGLSYKFHVPKIASDKYLAIVTAKRVAHDFGEDMVLIPAGIFSMGNTATFSGIFSTYELPVHSVLISRDFLMGKYEVTQKQYFSIMGSNPSYNKGDNLPVEKVSWYDAVEYCNKRSDIEGLDRCYTGSGINIICDWDANGYRLPTEAEWEYACKAGTTTDYYNGNIINYGCENETNLDKIAWYCGNAMNTTQPVGQKQPNAFGLFDMIGNVDELCWDGWDVNYNRCMGPKDPKGVVNVKYRVKRGGSVLTGATTCRSSRRYFFSPENVNFVVGFRVVRTY